MLCEHCKSCNGNYEASSNKDGSRFQQRWNPYLQFLHRTISSFQTAMQRCWRLWLNSGWRGLLVEDHVCVRQQDSVPCNTSRISQKWLSENFYNFTSLNFWPSNPPQVLTHGLPCILYMKNITILCKILMGLWDSCLQRLCFTWANA